MSADTAAGVDVREHEVQVLGAALTDQSLIDDLAEIVTGSDFYSLAHGIIWSAVTDLHSNGEPVNALSVSDALQRTGDLGRVGGYTATHQLVAATSSPRAGLWHAGRVRDAAIVRRVDQAGVRLRDLAANGAADRDEALAVVDAARGELDLLSVADEGDTPHPQAVWEAIAALKEPPGDPTPWPELTRAIAGWKPGTLNLIAARPRVGKSVLAVQCAVDMARRHKQAMIFSLEMTRHEVYHRMFSATASVNGSAIQNRTLTEHQERRLNEAARDIAALPLIVDDRSQVSVAQIRARVRAAQRTGPVGLVVVDLVGLVQPPASAPKGDRRVQVDMIAQSLKVMAMELRVPVLGTAQLNRGPEMRSDKLPTLADFRESGGLEAACDTALMLHRDPKDEELGTTLHLGVRKNRSGPETDIELLWQGHYSRALAYRDVP